MHRDEMHRERVAEKLAAALDAVDELRKALEGPALDRGISRDELFDSCRVAEALSSLRDGEDARVYMDRIEAYEVVERDGDAPLAVATSWTLQETSLVPVRTDATLILQAAVRTLRQTPRRVSTIYGRTE